MMVTRKFHLLAAWTTLLGSVVLTVVPPSLRPTTDAPHDVEHAAAFLIIGILFGSAYAGRERFLIVGAVFFCAALETLQLYIPGRHARLADFGGCDDCCCRCSRGGTDKSRQFAALSCAHLRVARKMLHRSLAPSVFLQRHLAGGRGAQPKVAHNRAMTFGYKRDDASDRFVLVVGRPCRLFDDIIAADILLGCARYLSGAHPGERQLSGADR
jgi:hypothetical protein